MFVSLVVSVRTGRRGKKQMLAHSFAENYSHTTYDVCCLDTFIRLVSPFVGIRAINSKASWCWWCCGYRRQITVKTTIIISIVQIYCILSIVFQLKNIYLLRNIKYTITFNGTSHSLRCRVFQFSSFINLLHWPRACARASQSYTSHISLFHFVFML